MLQRQGVFTEAIAGRVPVIYDPATTAPAAGGGVTRSQFADNTIPAGRVDPVARNLLGRYPLPTSAGNGQQLPPASPMKPWTRTSSACAWTTGSRSNRDHVFGRLTRFEEEFIPVTPLPDGSGPTTGTLGPQNTTSSSFASSYQRTFSNNVLNELRVGDTRRTVQRDAATTGRHGVGRAWACRASRPTPSFPDTLPTFAIAGYTQLGSPVSTASDFGTSVTQVADSFTWLKGRHTLKMGGDLRWERLNVVQPPSPTGSFTFSNLFSDLPGIANTGTPFASFLLGQVQLFSIDLQQEEIRNRAHFQEYFVPGRLATVGSRDGQRRRFATP